MIKISKYAFLMFCALTLQLSAMAQKIKVACIGASITYGATIAAREQSSYPAQLQQMLGNKYQVSNYGVSSTTLLTKGDHPYRYTNEYKDALAGNPDVVIIDLGGNDAKLINRIYLNEYEKDYHELIYSFKSLPSHPRIILLLAMPSFVNDTTGIWDPVIVNQVNPHIQQVAYDNKVEVIDMHSPFIDKETLMADKIHPNKEGATIMAQTVYEDIVKKRDTSFNIFKNLPPDFKTSSFYGYECAGFTFEGREARVVKPKWSAPDHPWIWRARFWGHEPQTDISLLQRGFHLVYCDVAELLGNDASNKYWNDFYDTLHKGGLAKKASLEGMSRGGVYVFNWAAINTDKVAAVYVDNPLLNIPSWADGVLKTDPDNDMLLAFKKDYDLSTPEQIHNFNHSPVDEVPQIVKGKYPILILCADEDEAVSPQDNTLLFEKKVKALNGNITVLHKPGFKHHPHSLPNPKPITDFILKATNQYLSPQANIH